MSTATKFLVPIVVIMAVILVLQLTGVFEFIARPSPAPAPAPVPTHTPAQNPPQASSSASLPSKIAFISGRDQRKDYFVDEVYIMDPDGTNQTRLTHSADKQIKWDTSWSPDGRWIAYVGGDDNTQDFDIYIVDRNGGEQIRLTNLGKGKWDPTWMPDGSSIIFRSNHEGTVKFYAVNVDGSELRRFTAWPDDCNGPDFSPNGKRVVFYSSRVNHWQIWTMNADGSNQFQLTNSSDGENLFSRWSPDGKQITFTSARDGKREVYVMNSDGSNVVRLTWNPVDNEYATDENSSWSPDGKKIAFVRVFHTSGSRNLETCVMDADGQNVQRLTNNPAVFHNAIFPSWSPR